MKKTPSTKVNIFASSTVLAFAFLLILDLVFRVSYTNLPIDPYNSPTRSWAWWAIKDFRQQDKKADVMLMGSSLMMSVVHGGDATYLNEPQKVAFHHRSYYLEKQLETRFNKKISTFAFPIGGLMSSDAYAITATLLDGPQAPRILIYGIAPRDFMDNTLSSPASTETFKYLEKFGKTDSIAWDCHQSFWSKADYILGKVCFLFGHKPDLVYLQQNIARQLIATYYKSNNFNETKAPLWLRKMALLQLPEDCGPSDLSYDPYSVTGSRFSDDSAQYLKRYWPFKERTYMQQLSFLKKTLALCHKNGTKVILVNMPLTPQNIELMPPGAYNRYLSDIKTLAQSQDAQVLDLNQPAKFPKKCFEDSVHLNGLGGVTFIDLLAGTLDRESKTAFERIESNKAIADSPKSINQ
jgi:hypothetical protein